MENIYKPLTPEKKEELKKKDKVKFLFRFIIFNSLKDAEKNLKYI